MSRTSSVAMPKPIGEKVAQVVRENTGITEGESILENDEINYRGEKSS